MAFGFGLAYGQVSEPYCVWEDSNNAYHVARVNPSSGNITSINTVSGMTGIVVPNTSVFKPTTGEYMCLALYTNTIVWLRFDVNLGGTVSSTPVTENWVGIKYHCKNDTIYALREDNSSYELVWIDPVNSVANPIANISGINAHAGSTFSIDPDADTYTFSGLSGGNFVIVVLDLNTGAIISQNPFPNNLPGQYFNCQDGKVYGLYEDNQNGTYHIAEVQPSTGGMNPLYQLNGVTPGFITESATFNGGRNQFVYRGFDGGNNPTMFAIDGATGSIVASSQMTENIAGLEDSICCTCPLPGPGFSIQDSADQIVCTSNSLGSPGSLVWDFGDGDTSHVPNPVHTYQQDGTYQVCLTASNNCGDSTVCDSVTIITVGLSSELEEGLSVFPNPGREMVQVTIPNSNGIKLVSLHELNGSLLGKYNVQDGTLTIDTSRLPQGLYFLKYAAGGTSFVKKLVVR